MKLSLCIATFNEEKNIHYPLDSAYDLADEVIIVDGGSTDKTVEGAKKYGKKISVIIADNPAMFHKNKEKAIEAAKGEWILQLDADEALSEELKKEIEQIIAIDSVARDASLLRASPMKTGIRFSESHLTRDTYRNNVAYWVPRKNWFLSRFLTKGGQYPDYTIRLYKNGVAHFPCKSVHENVDVTGTVGYLKNPILHYADPNFSRYLLRWDRYNNLEAEILKKKIKDQKSKIKNLQYFFDYLLIRPPVTFFSMYFRHLGLVDGLPGFIFALFSSIRFWAIYVKTIQHTN